MFIHFIVLFFQGQEQRFAVLLHRWQVALKDIYKKHVPFHNPNSRRFLPNILNDYQDFFQDVPSLQFSAQSLQPKIQTKLFGTISNVVKQFSRTNWTANEKNSYESMFSTKNFTTCYPSIRW